MVRFAHLADCHIGAWRDPKLRVLAEEAFTKAVNILLEERVDFVVIAGDLFNTALPGIAQLKHVVRELGRLRAAGVPVYLVAGNHDYSPTGKTVLDVLEEAELCRNLFRAEDDGALTLAFTEDPRTKVLLAGLPGRAGQLEQELYERLDRKALARAQGVKVFVFHAPLTELLPKFLAHTKSQSAGLLPEGFAYYAGGHVHVVAEKELAGYPRIVYPGPLFPSTFTELEKLRRGGLYLVDLDSDVLKTRFVPVAVRDVVPVAIDCTEKTPEEVQSLLEEELARDVDGAVVLARLSGVLDGNASAIDFRALFASCERRGAYACLKNTVGLSTPQLAEARTTASSLAEIERDVVAASVGAVPVGLARDEEERLFSDLLTVLSRPQAEGETKRAYEQRIAEEALRVLESVTQKEAPLPESED